jgi:1-acyl-sn-glycerol-3-phosphate acyltransferase
MLYKAIKFLFSPLIYFLFFVKVVGIENIPTGGGVIVCSNHISDFDPIILGVGINRKLNFMAKIELFRIPVLKNILRNLGTFPVNRGRGDTEAIKTALNILKNNEVLAMFPEGTRAKNNIVPKAKYGIAVLAYKSGAKILPVSIKTKDSNIRLFKEVKITILKSISKEELDYGEATHGDFKRVSNEIMQKIYASLD